MMITFKSLGNYGRLGNQLFQIATTMGVAIKNGERYIFPHWSYADRIDVLTAPIQDFNLFQWYDYAEPAFTYSPGIFDIPKDKHVNLSGYFQSEKYFEHCKLQVRNAILTETNLKRREELKKKYRIVDSVCAIHIRRGDYLGLPQHYVNLSENGYYPKAMQMMYDMGVKVFLVFSDDPDWCRRAINMPGVFTVRNETDFDDLLLMSGCTYHIIANSSFSWWGSWLAESKCIIAPSKWFGPAITHDTKDLYRPEMIIL